MNYAGGCSFGSVGACIGNSASSLTAPENSAGKTLPSLLSRAFSVQWMPHYDIR